MGEIDIWRVAQDTIDQFGEQAETVAAGRAAQAVLDADLAGERFWLRAVAAIRDLRRKSAASGRR